MAGIKKRADGRYLINVQIGFNDKGKPKFKSVYGKTQNEVKEKAAQLKSELEKGMMPTDRDVYFEEWANRWLELYKLGKQYNTIRMYKDTLRVHILPALGKFKLKDLKKHHIQELINEKSKQGLTRTLEIIKLTVGQILEQAVQNDYIYKNSCTGIALPSIAKTKKRALTDAEKVYIEKANFNIKQKVFVFTLLYTGIRKGEILALTKNDVDFNNNKIIISKTVIFKVNTPELKDCPKSDAGNRSIPIITPLKNILQEYISNINTEHLFTDTNGNIMSQSSFRKFWARIEKELNIAAGGDEDNKIIQDDITPHIFRHTYSTMLYYSGVDIKTAQYLLGHSTIQMTMDVYTHLGNENSIDVEDKLLNYINKNEKQSD